MEYLRDLSTCLICKISIETNYRVCNCSGVLCDQCYSVHNCIFADRIIKKNDFQSASFIRALKNMFKDGVAVSSLQLENYTARTVKAEKPAEMNNNINVVKTDEGRKRVQKGRRKRRTKRKNREKCADIVLSDLINIMGDMHQIMGDFDTQEGCESYRNGNGNHVDSMTEEGEHFQYPITNGENLENVPLRIKQEPMERYASNDVKPPLCNGTYEIIEIPEDTDDEEDVTEPPLNQNITIGEQIGGYSSQTECNSRNNIEQMICYYQQYAPNDSFSESQRKNILSTSVNDCYQSTSLKQVSHYATNGALDNSLHTKNEDNESWAPFDCEAGDDIDSFSNASEKNAEKKQIVLTSEPSQTDDSAINFLGFEESEIFLSSLKFHAHNFSSKKPTSFDHELYLDGIKYTLEIKLTGVEKVPDQDSSSAPKIVVLPERPDSSQPSCSFYTGDSQGPVKMARTEDYGDSSDEEIIDGTPIKANHSFTSQGLPLQSSYFTQPPGTQVLSIPKIAPFHCKQEEGEADEEDEDYDIDIIEGTPVKRNLTLPNLNLTLPSHSIDDEELERLQDEIISNNSNPLLACSGGDSRFKELVKFFARTFGYEYTSRLNKRYSVLVYDANHAGGSSFKWLLAVACKAPIVSVQWVIESLRSNCILPWEQYLHTFPLDHGYLDPTVPSPLVGVTCCIELMNNTYPGLDDLEYLCKVAGAVVIRNIDSLSSMTADEAPFPRFFFFKDQNDLTSQILFRCSRHLAMTVNIQWLYDSMNRYRLLPIKEFVSSLSYANEVLINIYNIPKELVPDEDELPADSD